MFIIVTEEYNNKSTRATEFSMICDRNKGLIFSQERIKLCYSEYSKMSFTFG